MEGNWLFDDESDDSSSGTNRWSSGSGTDGDDGYEDLVRLPILRAALFVCADCHHCARRAPAARLAAPTATPPSTRNPNSFGTRTRAAATPGRSLRSAALRHRHGATHGATTRSVVSPRPRRLVYASHARDSLQLPRLTPPPKRCGQAPTGTAPTMMHTRCRTRCPRRRPLSKRRCTPGLLKQLKCPRCRRRRRRRKLLPERWRFRDHMRARRDERSRSRRCQDKRLDKHQCRSPCSRGEAVERRGPHGSSRRNRRP